MGLNFWLHLLFQDKSVEKDITQGEKKPRMSEDHKDKNRGSGGWDKIKKNVIKQTKEK